MKNYRNQQLLNEIILKDQKLLNDIIDAWESLEGGQNYTPDLIEHWLREDMSPAINKARKALGRKMPSGFYKEKE